MSAKIRPVEIHAARCLRTRATDSSRHAVPRRVRNSWFRAAAIARRVAPWLRSRRISASAACSAGSGSKVLPVRREPGAEHNIAHALALAPFVPQSVAGAFPDSFPFPLGNRRHDVQHQPSGGRSGIQRLGYRHQGDAAALEPLRQLAGSGA